MKDIAFSPQFLELMPKCHFKVIFMKHISLGLQKPFLSITSFSSKADDGFLFCLGFFGVVFWFCFGFFCWLIGVFLKLLTRAL